MLTLTMAIGQFKMLFLAAIQTHKMPVATPHHSKVEVVLKNKIKLSLIACAQSNICQMYKMIYTCAHKTKNPAGNNPYRTINQTNYL